jgi:hypothetical protein
VTRLLASLAAASLFLPALALAEGKCEDDPFPLEGGLGVAWVIPVPGNAANVAEVTDPKILKWLDADGTIVPAAYLDGRSETKLHLAKRKQTRKVDEIEAWEKGLGLPITENGHRATQRYADDGYGFLAIPVGHPPVGKPSDYQLCTCVLARAVVTWDKGVQTTYLRSYFHSRGESSPAKVNFVPRTAVSYQSRRNDIWFTQRFNPLAQEAKTYLVLDVLTQKPLTLADDQKARLTDFQVAPPDKVQFAGRTWNRLRITREYATQDIAAIDDLVLPAPK